VERWPYDEIPAQVKRRPYEGADAEPARNQLPSQRTSLARGVTPTADGSPLRFSQVRRMRPGAGTGTLAAFLVLALEAGAMGA
jgi:hypothetical protein